jgi:hypothetical protein
MSFTVSSFLILSPSPSSPSLCVGRQSSKP